MATIGPTSALAGDDYPRDLRSKPQDSVFDPWRFYNRECTSFVAWRMNRDAKRTKAPWAFENFMRGGRWSNGGNWDDNARRLGYTISTKARVGAIAHWNASELGGGFPGHVAYVSKVHANGAVDVEEYNFHVRGRYGTRRAIRAPRYIYFNRPLTRSPIGHLDRVEGLSGGRVLVAGWAFDPDDKTRPVGVEAWIDGARGQSGARKVALGAATRTRDDVARAHAGAGARHGFKATIGGVAPGTHAVRVYALDRSGGNGPTYLGGETIRVPSSGAPNVPPPPAFSQSQHVWAAGSQYQSFMGDFNGDGQVDVGLRRTTDGRFYWRLGPAWPQMDYTWAAGAHFQSFMGDFNGDGQVDVGLRRITDGTFYWRLGPGFGQSQVGWSAGAGPEYQSFMGDFNGDGQVDVGLRRTTDGRFYWRLGPAWKQTDYGWAAGTQYQSFMGDFNGDGRVDLGLRRTTDGTFYWRLQAP